LPTKYELARNARGPDDGHGHHHLQTVFAGTGDWLMLTLLGSLLGFLGSAFPQLLKLFQEAQDRRHELAILDRQMEVQRQGHSQRLEEIRIEGDIQQSAALYQHDSQTAGYKWVEALRASVRPILTYAFFMLFAAVKIAGLYTMVSFDGMSLAVALPLIWDGETQALFAAVMAFWFGQRALRSR
jgi:hypothetical protein